MIVNIQNWKKKKKKIMMKVGLHKIMPFPSSLQFIEKKGKVSDMLK